MVRLFDIQDGVVIPTEHCYTLATLRSIMNMHPDDYLAVYQYLFYMTCPDPGLNPFFDVPKDDKEELILREIGAEFSTDDFEIKEALTFCETLYSTPSLRAYNGIKSMLDRLADYMTTTTITHGRDGNITALVNAAAKFEQIRMSYKGAYRDLQEELKGSVRGGERLAYDQM